MLRSIVLLLIAALFTGCGQDCPTVTKPSEPQLVFRNMEESLTFMGQPTLTLADGRTASSVSYWQEFYSPDDHRIGGKIFCIIIWDDHGQRLAEAYGIYCGGFQLKPDLGTVDFSSVVHNFGNEMSRMGNVKDFLEAHVADFQISDQPYVFATYNTVLFNTIPRDFLVACALRSGNTSNPAAGCGSP